MATLIPSTSGRASSSMSTSSRIGDAACRLVEVEEDQRQAGLGDGGVVVQDQSVPVGPVAEGGGRVDQHRVGTQVAA